MKSIFVLLLFLIPLRAADIVVDAADTSVVELRRIFDAFRSGQPAGPERLRQIGSRQVRMFPPLSFRSFYYNYTEFDVVKGTYPNLTYDFGRVDSNWVGPVVAEGADVILGYCYMPESLGPDALEPPSDYAAWEEFNYNWARHYYTKYGVTTFEIWNEPDYSEFFTGSRADYFEMYKYAARGIKRAVPQARIGGPALANNTGWVGPFLDYIIQNSLPVHFISYHAQDNGFRDEGSKYHRRYQDIVAELEARGMDSVTVVLDEFSYELNPDQGDRYTRSEAAAWFAGSFHFMLNNMPRLSRFNKTITDNGDLYDKWKYNGLVTTDNIPKAKFNVFRMYAMMPERGVRVTADSSLGAMASRNDSGLYLMVWNKDSQGQTADITLNNLPFKSDSVDIYTIDPDHASYFDNDSTAELELTETLALPDSGVPLSRALREYSVNLFVFRNSGVISSLAETRPIPRSLHLLSAYPNPFNPRTTLRLQLERRERLRISVWNVRGELLFKHPPAWFDAGESRVALDMNGYSGGVYFVEVRADAGWRQTVKVVLLR